MISITNRLPLRRSVFLGTGLLAFGVFGMAFGAASCQTLPAIQTNQCGNWVVEPDNGEACDDAPQDAGAADAATAEDRTRCGAPYEVGACRYICDYQKDDGILCPAGQNCGLDGICRKSAGLSESPISIAGGGTQRLMSGDFDGDGRSDVAAVGLSAVAVHFLTTEGNVGSTVMLPNEQGIPGVGDVNGDKLSDMVLTLDHSVGVLLGQEDRSFMSQSYTTMLVAESTNRLVPLGAFTEDAVMLAFREENGATSIDIVTLDSDGGHHLDTTDATSMPGTVRGAIAAAGGKSDTTSCGVAAFELGPADKVPARLVVAARCGSGNISRDPMNFVAGSPWAGAYFADVNDDKYPDLVYGVFDGVASMKVRKFDPMALPAVPLEKRFGPPEQFLSVDYSDCDSKSTTSLASEPLAVGDINLDGYPDFVDEAGILFYHPSKIMRLCNTNASKANFEPDPSKTPKNWAHAVIGDFNGDFLPDVLASRMGEPVLDLWILHISGNFNTLTIPVETVIAELVGGDLDGDLITDAVFRYDGPVDGMPGIPRPSPLFAIFGNPLALPTAPRMLGIVNDVQQIVAGRIKGTNLLGLPDPISDLVALSASAQPGQRKPLTLIQGNVTRNLASPLSLKPSTVDPIDSTSNVYGVLVSEFGLSACDKFASDPNNMSQDTELTPSNIVALGSDNGSIWLAGCKADGSSLLVQEGLVLDDPGFLLAPVDRDSTNDALGAFVPKEKGSALHFGIIDYKDMGPIGSLQDNLDPINANIALPDKKNMDVPFAFIDVDGNGTRDVILTGQVDKQRKIYIFWNGTDQDPSGTMSSKTMTEFDFIPADDDGPPLPEDWKIMDVTGLNVDDDDFKELAILTQNAVYIANVKRPDAASNPKGSLELPNDTNPFAKVRGGQALLAIDANSDGIEDLLVADSGKLLLFLGKERF